MLASRHYQDLRGSFGDRRLRVLPDSWWSFTMLILHSRCVRCKPDCASHWVLLKRRIIAGGVPHSPSLSFLLLSTCKPLIPWCQQRYCLYGTMVSPRPYIYTTSLLYGSSSVSHHIWPRSEPHCPNERPLIFNITIGRIYVGEHLATSSSSRPSSPGKEEKEIG